METYFTSDTHYGHKNIVKGTSEWENRENEQRVRDFNTMEEHNESLVKSINSMVKEHDELWHLGDWSFGGVENILQFRSRLNCKNIHLVFGNHDQHIENGKYLTYLHKDDGILSKNLKTGIKDCFSSVQYYKELSFKIPSTQSGKYGKTHLILSHFAMRVWNKSHHGSIMLYGHSHGTLDEFTMNTTNPTWIGDQYFIKNYRTMDVGVDTNNLYPYHLDEIVEKMRGRDLAMEVDHHNKNTN